MCEKTIDFNVLQVLTDIDMEYDLYKFYLLLKPPLILLDCSMKSETSQIKA